MTKKEEIMSLIDEINDIRITKKEVIKNQDYEAAANARHDEKKLLTKLDEVSGVKDFYIKVYNTERILQHLEIIINSTEELKKLRPNFRETFEDLDFNKYLVTLYKQRDEAYEAVLQLKSLIK
jgi:tRNA A37 N6-isopentenylltransferase MiaA